MLCTELWHDRLRKSAQLLAQSPVLSNANSNAFVIPAISKNKYTNEQKRSFDDDDDVRVKMMLMMLIMMMIIIVKC